MTEQDETRLWRKVTEAMAEIIMEQGDKIAEHEATIASRTQAASSSN